MTLKLILHFCLVLFGIYHQVSCQDQNPLNYDHVRGSNTPTQIESERLDSIYSRWFSIYLEPRTKECYFIDPILKGTNFSTGFVSMDSNSVTGEQYVISASLVNAKNITLFQTHGESQHFIGPFEIKAKEKHFQLCLWHPYNYAVKVYFGYSIEGILEYSKIQQLRLTKHSQKVEGLLLGIKKNLGESELDLQMSKALHAQDWHHMHATKNMVDIWSVGHILVMVLAYVGQVLFVRKLFDNSRTNSRLFTKYLNKN